MGRQIIISDKFRYNTENGNRIYKVEIEVPKNFKRKTAYLVPYYKEFEMYNAGGFTEKIQVGYECTKCKNKYGFIHNINEVIKYCEKCGAKIIESEEKASECENVR